MILLRIVLLPFTLLYGMAILVRLLFYKTGVLTRMSFDFPIICVGNIAAGGTGKTPHIAYLIDTFRHEYNLALLSRGYKRTTSGYLFGDEQVTPKQLGDEPFQIKKRYQIPVAVSENRVLGVPNLLSDAPQTQVILMDDGFQHLPIKAGFNIILTSYHNLFTKDWLLPSGRLREFRSGYKRAQVIIVTKCPANISDFEMQQLIKKIRPVKEQHVFFTTISYATQLIPVFHTNEKSLAATQKVMGVAGIADTSLFKQKLAEICDLQAFRIYPDHHPYTQKDLHEMAEQYQNLHPGTLIITTEKDAVKLASHPNNEILKTLPVYYLPINIAFIKDEELFKQLIRNYVTTNT